VFRRMITLAALVAAALLLAVPALAARVVVRVEGKTQTIFAPVPRVVEASNALEALEAASLAGEFYYHVTTTSSGPYVDQVGRYAASESTGWVFKVNGVSPPVGANAVTLKDGDSVLWYFAGFGASGGPPTLKLTRTSRRARRAPCYEVTAFDDAGKVSLVGSATVRVDGRQVRTSRQGLACPGPHRGLVRATAPGMIRSNALA
jgi:Domain of unknown function (DUF4430)